MILNSSMLESGSHLKLFHVGIWQLYSILDSDTLLSSLRFTQKHSHSSLTQTNSIWLKLIHSYLTWWCQPSWNLPSWIQPFWTKKYFTHSFSTLWWQPSWILPSWIQPFCTKQLHWFILTQLDDGSHLKLFHVGIWHCHLGFRHLVIFSQIHSKTLARHSDFWLKLIQSN